MTARTPRSLRRKAGLVVALATALSLPGIGHAGDNNSCTRQGSSDPNAQHPDACPEFSPGYSLDLRYPFRDTRADVNLEMSQASYEANALSWEWYLPAEWRFNTNIRPAGGSPSSCNGLFNANGSINQAEAISDGIGMIGRVGGAVKYWGRTRFLPSNNANYRPHTAQFAYWRTVGNTTTLCAMLQTYTTNTSGGGPAYPVVFPVTLERGTFGDYGWKVTVPVESIHAQMAAHAPTGDFSLTTLDLELDGLTSGTWHLENNIPTKTSFSRAPRETMQTQIGTRSFVCTSGGPTTSTRYTMATCPAGNLMSFPTTGLQEFPFSVMQPPVYAPSPWATITRAGDTVLPGAGTYYERPVKGFGFTQNSTDLAVTWTALTPATLPAGVTPTGYVLALHKVTQHGAPTTAAEIAAGRVMFARDFSNTATRAISFDLTQLPENQQLGTVDGKYNVSLVTVYNTPFGDGYRSDGLCDGASLNPPVADNGQGVLCPADRPIWMASGAARDRGTSLYQVLVREENWPRRYLYSSGGQPLGVLLLDIPNKKAEYTIWGAYSVSAQISAGPAGPLVYSLGQGIADQGAATVFRSTSDLMVEPTGPASGIVRFGDFDLESEGFTWQFAAQIQGLLPSQVDGPVPDARGQFTMYNARGGDLDWLMNTLSRPMPAPGSDPTTYPNELLANVTRPSGTPQTIMGDFTGSAF